MNLYLFNLIYSLSNYGIIKYFSIFLSYYFIYIFLIIIVVWALYTQKRKMYTFSILFLSGFSTWFIAETIKNITRISRPIVLNPIIIEKGLSFPSEHSAISMVVAIILFSFNKKIGIFAIIISILIGISRIILGVHYPFDVLVGWVLGLLVGFIFIKLFKKV